MSKTLVLLVALLSPLVCHAETEHIYQVVEAQKRVEDYRALRRACAITKGDQRRVCSARLSEATDEYVKAKNMLKMYHEAAPMLGQIEIDQ